MSKMVVCLLFTLAVVNFLSITLTVMLGFACASAAATIATISTGRITKGVGVGDTLKSLAIAEQLASAAASKSSREATAAFLGID